MNTCRSCTAPIEWATTVPAGKKVPLELDPVAFGTRGSYVLVDGWAYVYEDLVERIVAKDAHPLDGELEPRAAAEQHIATNYAAHLSHFATCPSAQQHRRSSS